MAALASVFTGCSGFGGVAVNTSLLCLHSSFVFRLLGLGSDFVFGAVCSVSVLVPCLCPFHVCVRSGVCVRSVSVLALCLSSSFAQQSSPTFSSHFWSCFRRSWHIGCCCMKASSVVVVFVPSNLLDGPFVNFNMVPKICEFECCRNTARATYWMEVKA